MRLRSLLSPTAGLALGLVAVAGTGTAVAATGGSFILGKTNYASTLTTLSNSGGTALYLKSPSTKPALAVSNTKQIPNLNAALLNGLNAGQLLPREYVYATSSYPSSLHPNATDGNLMTFTFSAPQAGFVLATVDFGVRVRNTFDSTNTDCHVQTQLNTSAVAPTNQTGSAGLGYMDSWINGNLPTENGGGTYLELDGSLSRVFAVHAGSNTMFLNGNFTEAPACTSALWGPITFNAVFAQHNPGVTTAVNQ